jgi:hypothetical protein
MAVDVDGAAPRRDREARGLRLQRARVDILETPGRRAMRKADGPMRLPHRGCPRR